MPRSGSVAMLDMKVLLSISTEHLWFFSTCTNAKVVSSTREGRTVAISSVSVMLEQ